MDTEPSVRSFYRIAKVYPPGEDEYLTARQRGRLLPVAATGELVRSWDGLSAYDSEEGARQQAKRLRGRLGWLVVRYDVPARSEIVWEKSLGPGHYDLFGDPVELRRYLSDAVVDV